MKGNMADANEIEKVLGGRGWDDLEKARELNEADQKQRAEDEFEVAQKFHACFSTPSGRFVLEHLRGETEMKAAFAVGGDLPADQMGFVREGQNSIYRRCRELCELAEKGPPHLKGGSDG